MKVKDFELRLHARPFRPFDIRVDGEVVHILHPEQVFLTPDKTMIVADVGDGIHIFDVDRISKLTVVKRSRPAAA
jgi:hypothetical protein